MGGVPPARGPRADDVRADDRRVVDLHRHPGHRAGHVRVLRGDRPPQSRRLAGRDDHADRGPRRHGRRAAAGGDHERRRRAVHRDRRAPHPAPARDALPRRAGRRRRRRGGALPRGEGRRPRAERRPARQRGRPRAAAARGGLRGRHRHRPDQRARPARRLRARPHVAGGGRGHAARRPRRVHPPLARRDGRALRGDGGLQGPRRRGLRLRQLAARGGEARRLRARVRLPRLRARLRAAAVLRGEGTVPLGGAVGRSRRHRGHRPGDARGVPRRRAARALDRAGGRADRVPGPARAHLLARLRRAAPARAALQRDGARAAS